MRWGRIVALYDWVGRVHFAATTLAAMGAAVVGVIAHYFEGWDLLAVFLAMLGTFVGVAFLCLVSYLAWDRWDQRRKPLIKEAEPQRISLLEAATRAHEQLRNCPISIAAEAFTDSPQDILIAYCNMLTRMHGRQQPLITVYGIVPPSRILEPINLIVYRSFDFVSEDGAIILKQRYSERRCTNLSVSTHELEAAIQELGQREG